MPWEARHEPGSQRLHVDWTRCDGHGSCAELLPELLALDDWGFPVSRTGERDPDVPAALERHARRAAEGLPAAGAAAHRPPRLQHPEALGAGELVVG